MFSKKDFHRVIKVQEPPEDKVKLSRKTRVQDKIGHSLPLVDQVPEASLGTSPQDMNTGEAEEGIIAEASPVEHKDQQHERASIIGEEVDTGREGKEVDPFESSYYMIDDLLTKLINIAIERNDCQLRRVEVLKELEKAKKLHDYLSSLHGTSVPNGAAIERQGGAYILYFQHTFYLARIKYTCQVEQELFLQGSGVYFPH